MSDPNPIARIRLCRQVLTSCSPLTYHLAHEICGWKKIRKSIYLYNKIISQVMENKNQSHCIHFRRHNPKRSIIFKDDNYQRKSEVVVPCSASHGTSAWKKGPFHTESSDRNREKQIFLMCRKHALTSPTQDLIWFKCYSSYTKIQEPALLLPTFHLSNNHNLNLFALVEV